MRLGPFFLFCLYPFLLSALPEGAAARSGKVDISKEENKLLLRVSDKAIIHFDRFDISSNEQVEFIQPHKHSAVLSRIESSHPSSILGTLTSNGRVFLVNQAGVYFGSSASVDVGSLVATTMDIFDHDFKKGHFAFFLKAQGREGTIINEGILKASQEGAVVLLANHVENKGTIVADLGKVVIASVEKATIDFTGDGLISFVLDRGLSKLDQERVSFDITEVVNREGLIEGTCLTEEKGIIRIASQSQIYAQDVALQAEKIEVKGTVIATGNLFVEGQDLVCLREDAVNPLILHAGSNVTMKSNNIDIFAWQNEKTRLCSGGDMVFISDHPISADAKFFSGGNFSLMTTGGKPVGFKSLFDPIITAVQSVSFGTYLGPSLKVEAGGNITSLGDITITGPDATVCVSSGCAGDPDCSLLSSQPALILIAGSSVASFSCNPVPIMSGGTTFNALSGSGSTITLDGVISGNPSDLTTVTFTGNVVLAGATTISSGTGITINGTIDGSFPLTMEGGNGTITVTGPIGNSIPLGLLTIDSVSGIAPFPNLSTKNITADGFVTFASTITTGSITTLDSSSTFNLNSGIGANPITINGPILAATDVLAAGTDITFNGDINLTTFNKTINVSASGTLDINGNISTQFGVISFPSSIGTIRLGGNINSLGNIISLQSSVTLDRVNTVIVDARPSGIIIFGNTINADSSPRSLGLFAGAGVVFLEGDVGNATALKTLVAEAMKITYKGTVYHAGRQDYTANLFNFIAPGLITLTSSQPGILFNTGSVQLSGGANLLVETNNGPFSFPSLVASATQNSDILAGSGTVTLGSIGMLNNLLVNAGNILLNGPFTGNDLTLNSQTSITNLGTPFVLSTKANAIFNATSGTVGTEESPLALNASWIVFAGAPQKVAAFTGTTADGTIHPIPENPPCPLIFNGIVLVSCPVVPRSPLIPAREFYVPGIYSQYNSLAADDYFLPEIVDASYVQPRLSPLYETEKIYEKPSLVQWILQIKEKTNYRS